MNALLSQPLNAIRYAFSTLVGKKASKRQKTSLTAKYDAAQTNRENQNHWLQADHLSADSALSPDVRQKLRSRARYEADNNTYCAGMIATIANDTIGVGPELQMQSGENTLDKRVERDFWRWSCAIDLHQKLRIMRQAKCRDGESIGLLVFNPTIEDRVKVDVKVIECDQLSANLITPADYYTDGLIFDDFDNVIGYRILKHHPGDNGRNISFGDYEVYPASQVIHIHHQTRPGQHRGFPEITPALPLYAQLRRYTMAVIAAAETAADIAVLITTQAPPQDPAELEPLDLIDIERRTGMVMPKGWQAQSFKGDQPTTTYNMFKREIINEISRCLNMPFNVAAGDSSSYNYSSGRLDHKTYFKSIRIERTRWEIQVLDRIFAAWWFEYSLINGLQQDVPEHQWRWDGDESADPMKDASANALLLETNQTTLAELYSKRGQDWEAAMLQRAREVELIASLGLAPQQPPARADASQGGEQQPPNDTATITAGFNEDQPRDEQGRFASDGSGGDTGGSGDSADSGDGATDVETRQQNESDALDTQHASESDALSAKHDSEMSSLSDRHSSEQDALQKSQDDEVFAINGKHADERATLEDKQGAERVALRDRHAAEEAELSTKHDEEKAQLDDELTTKHGAETADLESRHESEKAELQFRIEKESAELSSRHDKESQELEASQAKEREFMDSERTAIETRQAKEISELTQKHADEVSQNDKRVAELESRHEAETAAMESRHEQELQAATDRHEKEVSELESRHEAEIEESDSITDEMQTRHENELSDIESTHETELTSHDDKRDELDAIHESQTEKLSARHEKESEKLTSSHEKESDKLDARHENESEKLANAQDSEREKAESALEKTQDKEVSALQKRHEKESDQQDKDHEKQTAELIKQQDKAEAELENAHEKQSAELEKRQEKESQELESLHEKQLAELDAAQNRQRAELDARHEQELNQ
ncbi:MAG: phage portal protein [Caulobacteraceae bacterium]|nr:phage portal protein [Caulobacteraceae bacterium]